MYLTLRWSRRISCARLQCECSGCLASEQPDNFKITARPGLPRPEWPNVSGWSGQFWAGTTLCRWHAAGGRADNLPGKLLPCAAHPYTAVFLEVYRPFRQPESLGHVWGHEGWRTTALINHFAFWEQPFRDAGGERKVGAGACALLFAVSINPWLPVTPTVTSTVTVLYVVPRRSHKVHASTLVLIAPLSQRLPLLVRCCQI